MLRLRGRTLAFLWEIIVHQIFFNVIFFASRRMCLTTTLCNLCDFSWLCQSHMSWHEEEESQQSQRHTQEEIYLRKTETKESGSTLATDGDENGNGLYNISPRQGNVIPRFFSAEQCWQLKDVRTGIGSCRCSYRTSHIWLWQSSI